MIKNTLIQWGNSLLNLFFPDVCTVCHTPLVEGEDIMCLKCALEFPRIEPKDFHDNELTDRLASLHAPIEKGTAMYHYLAGTPYVKLIHDTKYNRRPCVGRKLACTHAMQLATTGFFDDIDVIIPIPLHFTKLWLRGYNQSYEIALGLQNVTGLDIADNLRAIRPHSTQTRKNARQRRLNSTGTLGVVRAEELHNKHILVVDDVITTGSTILAGLEAIHAAVPTAKLSVYSLALAKMR